MGNAAVLQAVPRGAQPVAASVPIKIPPGAVADIVHHRNAGKPEPRDDVAGSQPKTLTLREWANLDTAKSRKKFQDFLTLKMQPYSDVLSVAEASRFTGYHHNTLTNWCHNGYIRYFEISGGYMIPKSCLLNFLLSPHILDSYRPSKKLVDLAKEFSRQGKSTKKPTAK